MVSSIHRFPQSTGRAIRGQSGQPFNVFESWVNAHDRIAAQLTAPQRQYMRRIAPHWYAGG